MRHCSILLTLLVSILFVSPILVSAQTKPAFPQVNGVILNYKHFDASGQMDATCAVKIRNVVGGGGNGSLEMAYCCYDKNGKAYFDAPNECVLKVEQVDGQTFIDMDKMAKTMKMMDLISAGDVSTIYVPMRVGESLADTKILSTLGPFKATLTISDRKVLDHKTIKIDGHSYDCWLVHEKILTKTPFSTDTATADTWYAEGAGCVSQKVYNAKGKLKGRLELVSVE